MSATLRVTREGFGLELRRGRFEVMADGKNVGSIDLHETVTTALEPGRHTLQIQKGRYTSKTHAFEVADEQLVNFRCHGANIWPRYVASIAKPDLAISLVQE
jgi:hypothetical protein